MEKNLLQKSIANSIDVAILNNVCALIP